MGKCSCVGRSAFLNKESFPLNSCSTSLTLNHNSMSQLCVHSPNRTSATNDSKRFVVFFLMGMTSNAMGLWTYRVSS